MEMVKRSAKLIALLYCATQVVACIEVPVDPLEAKVLEAEGRERIEQYDIKQSLRHAGVRDSMVMGTFFDRLFYRRYSVGDIEKVLAENEWMREFEYDRDHRKCTDFAVMFQAVCLISMPSAPIGTIEYFPAHKPPKVGYQMYGHKAVLFFYYNNQGKLIPVIVDPRTTQFIRLGSVDISISEINM